MPSARTSLLEGTKVLTTQGIALTGQIAAAGVTLHYSYGDASTHGWAELDVIRGLEDGEVCALSESLRPLWDALAEDVREAALFKLEIVQEILTGYRDGHHALARPGEPRPPYGPSGASESKRCTAMATELNAGATLDRRVRGRLQDGETPRVGSVSRGGPAPSVRLGDRRRTAYVVDAVARQSAVPLTQLTRSAIR